MGGRAGGGGHVQYGAASGGRGGGGGGQGNECLWVMIGSLGPEIGGHSNGWDCERRIHLESKHAEVLAAV